MDDSKMNVEMKRVKNSEYNPEGDQSRMTYITRHQLFKKHNYKCGSGYRTDNRLKEKNTDSRNRPIHVLLIYHKVCT